MSYEVEKTIKMDKKEYTRVKKLLDKKAKKLEEYTSITYLFRKPAYVRIRYKTNSTKATITQKKNVKKTLIREEIEFQIDRKDIPKFAKLLINLGFKECLHVKIENQTYSYKGMELKLTIGPIGLLLDIEKTANNKMQFRENLAKIDSFINEFNLDGESYMRFWNEKERIAKKLTKPISTFKELNA